MSRPDLTTLPQFYKRYVEHVKHFELLEAFNVSSTKTIALVKSLSEEQGEHRYAPGKWSIKEVLQHMIDTERIFAYRALAFARKESSTLPSFDEKKYAENSNADTRAWNDLIDELIAVRKTTEFLFNSFSNEQLNTVGKASNYEMSVKALGYTIAGHVAHHIIILKERYLKD